jgi:hypothetical protein
MSQENVEVLRKAYLSRHSRAEQRRLANLLSLG